MPRHVDQSPLAAHAATPAELRERIEAERAGTPFLVLRDGAGDQRLLVLDNDAQRVTIGRGTANDVALEWDTEVSRLHAELECLGGEWTVADDGLSRNGSFLNGQRISGRHRLRDGDVLRVGRTSIAYRVPETAEDSPTVAAGSRPELPELSATQRSVLAALCRPYKDTELATPATNQQIAEELFSPSTRSRRTCARCLATSASSTCRRTRSAPTSRCARCRTASCRGATCRTRLAPPAPGQR